MEGPGANQFVGVVTDPFLGTNKTYNLFSTTDLTGWMWVNGQTGDITFLQYWKPSIQDELIHYYPWGIQSKTLATAYDFQIFQCKHQ